METNMTPKTDAVCAALFHDGGPEHRNWPCSERDAAMLADHARKLERINAELLAACRMVVACGDLIGPGANARNAQSAARAAIAKATT